jgi:hypothetical protein
MLSLVADLVDSSDETKIRAVLRNVSDEVAGLCRLLDEVIIDESLEDTIKGTEDGDEEQVEYMEEE